MLRSSALRCFSICTRLALFRISGREKTIFRPIFYLYLLRLNSFGRCWPKKVPSLHLVDLNLNSMSSFSVIFVDMWRWWLVEVKLSKVCTAGGYGTINWVGQKVNSAQFLLSHFVRVKVLYRGIWKIYFQYHAGWFLPSGQLHKCDKYDKSEEQGKNAY